MRERVRITKLCSECGALVRFVDGQERLVDLSVSVQTYCPDCGAHDSFRVGNCAPGNNGRVVIGVNGKAIPPTLTGGDERPMQCTGEPLVSLFGRMYRVKDLEFMQPGNWEIVDDHGVVYSGPEHHIRYIWAKLHERDDEFENVEWTGDLKLVEVHEVYNG